jgi:hypothetical protein
MKHCGIFGSVRSCQVEKMLPEHKARCQQQCKPVPKVRAIQISPAIEGFRGGDRSIVICPRRVSDLTAFRAFGQFAALVDLGSLLSFSERAHEHVVMNSQRRVGAVVDRGGWEEPS